MAVPLPRRHWRSSLLSPRLPYRTWLTRQGSLTARLQARCGRFRVAGVRQWRGPVPADEARRLGRCGGPALIREVVLRCDGAPAVFAHSVLPGASLTGAWRGLGRMGNRSLGAALFKTPAVRRGRLEYARLDARHTLYARAASLLDAPPRGLWARRSRFRLGGRAILVTEVFLPAVLTLATPPGGRA